MNDVEVLSKSSEISRGGKKLRRRKSNVNYNEEGIASGAKPGSNLLKKQGRKPGGGRTFVKKPQEEEKGEVDQS